jgi:hypothetical protein
LVCVKGWRSIPPLFFSKGEIMNAKEVVEQYLEENETTLKWFNSPLHAARVIRQWGYEKAEYMDEPTYDEYDVSFLDLYVYLVTGMISHNGKLQNPFAIGL